MKYHSKNNTDSILNLLVFLISLLFFGLLSIYFGQDANWDLQNYHYYNPFAFINGRLGFDYQPAQVQTYFNPLIDIPFYLLVNSLPPIVVGFLLGALQGLNFYQLFRIGKYIFEFKNNLIIIMCSLICAIVGVYGSIFVSEIGTTLNDSIVSLFGLLSLLILFKYFKPIFYRKNQVMMKVTLWSGFILGLGLGLKLTFAVIGLGCLFALPLLFKTFKARLLNTISWGIGVITGALTSSGFWMLILWDKFQSPLFPFYNKFIKSPYFELCNVSDNRFFPKNLAQQLFYPFYFAKENNLVMELCFRDFRFAIIYGLVLLGILKFAYDFYQNKINPDLIEFKEKYNYRIVVTRFFIIYFIVSYVVWQFTFSVYRYLLVLELLGPIIIVLLSLYIFNDFYKSMAVVIILFAIITFGMKAPDWGRLPWGDSYFGVKLPEMEYGKNTIVVITGSEPLSYIIPFFPAETRFIRVESNFQNPSQKNLMQQEIRQLLAEPKGQIHLLTKSDEFSKSAELIKSYKIYTNRNNCKPITSRLTKDLLLCTIEYKKDTIRSND
jgi:hypothetical protein